KPDNIFLERTEEGAIQPKLIDFGVVKVDAADSDMKLTREGAMVGSPCYLSPEQARGEDATAQSDVWAFSVVLYETLTGQLPFDADNFRALLRTIVENEPAPIAEHGVVDEELWQIIARGLSKDTDGRWKSIHDMGVALAEWLVAQGYEEDCRGNFIESTWLGGRPSLASLDVLEQWPPPAARPPSRRTPISQRQLPSDDEIRKLRSGSHSSLSGTDLTETVESSLVEVDPQATTRRRLVAGIAIVAFLVTAWVALRRPPEDTSHATETTPSAVAAPSASAAPPASVTTEPASGSAEPVASAASPPSASPVASSAPVPVPTPTPKAPPEPNPPGLMTPDF
ncbi:MAG: protein kinase, partial [Myxococcales bacterium]|nr:protein kinase [Myxococcales bacterium]